MKRTHVFFTAIFCALLLPATAHACRCTPDNTEHAKALLADSSVALARVYVRGTNPKIGQSMLELRETLHGGLSARDFRAKFATHSCGVVPQNKTEQTLLIKFEQDGTYRVMDDCDQLAVKTYLNQGN